MKINLLQATIDNWQEVGSIEGQSGSRYFKAYTTKEELSNYISGSKVFFIVSNGQKVGTIGFKKVSNDTAQLEGLNIIPNSRKMGFGREAINKLIELIIKGGYKKIMLFVHPKNTLALIMYISNGFVITGYKENFYGDGEPRLMMEKVISNP